MTKEFFGDGRDGDFTVPAAATTVLTRDMYWRDLTFPTNSGDSTIINPNGFVIRVSGTLRGPDTVQINSTLSLLSSSSVLTKYLSIEHGLTIFVITEAITGVPTSVEVGSTRMSLISTSGTTMVWSGYPNNRLWNVTTVGAFPSLSVSSVEFLVGVISANGSDSLNEVGGSGLSAGTIGGSGSGSNGTIGNGTSTVGAGFWTASNHAGKGGDGGIGAATSSGIGGGNSLLAESDGSMDLLTAVSMRTSGGTVLYGGAGGASGGGGGGSAKGGGGGGGGGCVAVLARAVENASNVLLSANGGRGGDATGIDAGGGGGGGGGSITTIVYRAPFPVTSVQGGRGGLKTFSGGVPVGDGVTGSDGQSGTVIPFRFVIGTRRR